MAVTGFWPVFKNLKATLDYADNPDKTTALEYLDEDLYAALRYAENDDKTDRKIFVGGINCSAQNAYAEMIAVQRRFWLRGKVAGYHGIQSFREGEVTPGQAFAIGKETARQMWGDQYQVLVTVHLNTDNVHCHFVVNPVSFKDGVKFKNKIGDHKELRKNKRRQTATGKTSLFSGLGFCAYCGSKLQFCAAKSLKADQEFFRYANYKSGRGECTIHYIRNVVLEQIVSVAVGDLADFVTCHESFFLQMIGKQQSAGKDQNIRSVKSDIAAGKHRIDEIDRLIAKLYEDNFAGKLSDEHYSRMAAKYEKEQAELLQSVSTKEKELAELERESVDIRLLLAGLREYSSMETLTPEVVNKIIRRIEVHNSEIVNGHKRN